MANPLGVITFLTWPNGLFTGPYSLPFDLFTINRPFGLFTSSSGLSARLTANPLGLLAFCAWPNSQSIWPYGLFTWPCGLFTWPNGLFTWPNGHSIWPSGLVYLALVAIISSGYDTMCSFAYLRALVGFQCSSPRPENETAYL